MRTDNHLNRHSQQRNHRLARAMLLVAAAVFLLFSIFYNEFILSLVIRDLGIMPRSIPRIREVRVYFALWGVALVLQSECVRKVPWLKEFFNNRLVMNIFLATLTTTVLIAILEFSLRPFVYLPGKASTLFMKDDLLGWRLRPNARGFSRGVQATINSKATRGPELPYTKQPKIRRILYVGDSVTFGYGLEEEQTFPFRVEALLRKAVGDSVETVNMGVDGYSPWQEHMHLRNEGLRYQPDLIVVSFILNDVTDRLDSSQLQNLKEDRRSLLDELIARSNTLYFIKMISGNKIFGGDLEGGVRRRETLYVGHLVYYPDRPEVHEAWKATLEDLGRIFNLCKEHQLPMILVVFPFAFQFDNAETLSTPQRIVCNFARENNIPFIDLLPLLDKRMRTTGTKAADYFLDDLHPSALGSAIVADTLAGFIRANNLLSHN